ncbi:MAG: CAP domain-containing protein [Halobacteriota archaeon]
MDLRSIVTSVVSAAVRLAVVVLLVGAVLVAAGAIDLPQVPAIAIDERPQSTPGAETDAVDEPTPREDGPAGLNESAIERAIHAAVNEQRADRGTDPVAYDPELAVIARYYSNRMATEEFFAHTAPDGETLGERYDRFGYTCRVPAGFGRYRTGGENLAQTWYSQSALSNGEMGARTENEIGSNVVDQWMDSPSHRENLLDEHWRRHGIGVVVVESNGGVRVYATQNFC